VRRRGAAALLCSGLALLAPVGCSRGDDPSWREVADERAAQARSAAATAGLPADVQDVLALAARAPAARFTATYASGAERLVVAQVPPRRRVDVLGAGGTPVESVVTDGDGGAVRCERPGNGGGGGGRWRCTEVDGEAAAVGAFSPELVARTVEALAASAGAYRTDVYVLTVARVRARCLRSTPVDAAAGGGPSQLCVAADGVPLLLDRGDGTPVLRAVAYRASAADEDVRRPD
jgi:hypothetical protein